EGGGRAGGGAGEGWRAGGRRGVGADDEGEGEVGPRHSSCEAGEQSGAACCGAIRGRADRSGASGAKGGDQGKCGPANHALGTEPDQHATCAGTHTESSKGKEEGKVHLALPPHQRRTARRGVLRT